MPRGGPGVITARQFSAWAYVAAMLVVVAAGALAVDALAKLAQSPYDPRYLMNYSFGAGLPIRAFQNVEHGWTVLLAVWLMLALLAILGWRLAAAISAQEPNRARFIVGAQLVVLLSLSLFPVVFSPDMYAYVLWARLYGVFGVNPYLLHAPLVGGDHVIATLVRFYGNPPPSDDYGPGWTLLAGLIARLESAASLIWQLWTQRALAIGGAVAATAGLLVAMRGVPVRIRTYGAALFAFHPLVLYETAVGGHNDILLVALAVWAFALVDALPLVAGLLLGAAVAIKLVAVVALPFLVIRAARRGFANGGACALIAIVTVALCALPFWAGPATVAAIHVQAGLMIWSLGSALKDVALRLAPVPISPPAVQNAVQVLLLAAFAAVALASMVRYALRRHVGELWRTVTAFLWALPALNPWYVMWLSPAMATGGRWAVYAWWLGILVFAHYIFDVGQVPTDPAAIRALLLTFDVAALVVLILPGVIALRTSPQPAVDD